MLKGYLNGDLFADHIGSGDVTVIFLHGWARSKEDFSTIAAGLVDRFHGTLGAVLVDLPGFGTSPLPPEAGGSAMYADTVGAMIVEGQSKGTIGGTVFVVGHSFGGRISLYLIAGQWAHLVKGAVLSGVPLYRPSNGRRPPMRYRLVRSFARRGLVPQSMLDRSRRRYGSADYNNSEGVMRSVMVACANEDYSPQIASAALPVLMIWGERDTSAPLEMAQKALTSFGEARLEILEDVGHMTPLLRPESMIDLIDHFVRELS